nr:DUF4126 family protein [Pseudenhygromyxa sp. WMMC2535]
MLTASSLTGTRSSLTLLILAIASRAAHFEDPQDWMSSNVGLGLLLALVVIEELAEQDEDLRALVDLFAYALRAGAGALAATYLQSADLTFLPDWGAALIGAGGAVATHHLRSRLHEQLSGLGDHLLNPRTWLAWLELGGVLGLTIALLLSPLIALAFVLLATLMAVVALYTRRAAERRLFRRPCPSCNFHPRIEASRCPSCKTSLEIQRLRS